MRKNCEQAAEAVQAKRARKVKTRTNQKYLKMSSKQLQKRLKLGASITRFVIDAGGSDEERATVKRELAVEKLNRASRKRDAKRKTP